MMGGAVISPHSRTLCPDIYMHTCIIIGLRWCMYKAGFACFAELYLSYLSPLTPQRAVDSSTLPHDFTG